jgi:hypothetical protein
MSAKFKITYAGADEAVVLSVRPIDILRIEREAGPNGMEATIESSYKLAWMAARTELDFESWLEGIDDIEPVEQPADKDAAPSS